ncbi:hypothetical protein BASA83_007654 [Batrachochytrium salamandrivorans]|nr:hypothetical protein BASA83_007654 [Batrachochytrium salamandrivorans]
MPNWISPFFLLFGIHPRLPTDETPPQNTLAPLDEIERMEENSDYCQKLGRKLVKQDPLPMFEPRHSLKQCGNVVASRKYSRLFSRLRLPNAVNQNDLALVVSGG